MFPISDSKPSKKFPIVNIALIAFTAFVFYLQLINPDAFTLAYALVPRRINLSDLSTLYPFVTSIFLHGGWLHIISNLWFLWIFGDNVEGEVGHIPYLFLYIISGIAGAFAQYLIMSQASIPMLGASGAIAGVLGAYYYFFPHHKIRTILPIFFFITIVEVSAYIMLGYWFILQLFSGAVSIPGSGSGQGGIAFLAHAAGFVAGIIIGRILAPTEKRVLEGEVV